MLLIILACITIALLAILIFLHLALGKKIPAQNALDEKLLPSFQQLEKGQDRQEKLLREESGQSRTELGQSFLQLREEVSKSVKNLGDSLSDRLKDIGEQQKNQFEVFSRDLNVLTKTNREGLEENRKTLEDKLRQLSEGNQKKLDEMRAIVDEKLQSTLEKRLGESFKQVREQLESVYKGLGDMQKLAVGVGDLKKVLTNVKARGTWGEMQLSVLLEQILTPEQYAANIATKKGSDDRVEFAIKLPGKDDAVEDLVWLPIDAKFPQEDYQRLTDAQDKADPEGAETALKALEKRIKLEAKTIQDKYIDPPYTTDFGILFLPTEGLYAEVIRRPGLCDKIQREHRILITGPTTLGALLNSLQMGFRTLAIQKRSSDVWKVLGEVKKEFGNFGGILDRVHKQLETASKTISSASTKTRTIERKLNKVEELPSEKIAAILEPDTDSNRLDL